VSFFNPAMLESSFSTTSVMRRETSTAVAPGSTVITATCGGLVSGK